MAVIGLSLTEPDQGDPFIMLHIGLDLSRRRLDNDLLCEDGSRIERGAVAPDADGLRGLVGRVEAYRESACAAIESMNGARFGHNRLEELGWRVEIADAQKTKGLAPLARKTDRIDACRSRSRSPARCKPGTGAGAGGRASSRDPGARSSCSRLVATTRRAHGRGALAAFAEHTTPRYFHFSVMWGRHFWRICCNTRCLSRDLAGSRQPVQVIERSGQNRAAREVPQPTERPGPERTTLWREVPSVLRSHGSRRSRTLDGTHTSRHAAITLASRWVVPRSLTDDARTF